jgi:hypothetical protein
MPCRSILLGSLGGELVDRLPVRVDGGAQVDALRPKQSRHFGRSNSYV